MTSERMELAVNRAARALAEHEGNERVFGREAENGVCKQAADSYREQARIAIGTFVVAIRDAGAVAPTPTSGRTVL